MEIRTLYTSSNQITGFHVLYAFETKLRLSDYYHSQSNNVVFVGAMKKWGLFYFSEHTVLIPHHYCLYVFIKAVVKRTLHLAVRQLWWVISTLLKSGSHSRQSVSMRCCWFCETTWSICAACRPCRVSYHQRSLSHQTAQHSKQPSYQYTSQLCFS